MASFLRAPSAPRPPPPLQRLADPRPLPHVPQIASCSLPTSIAPRVAASRNRASNSAIRATSAGSRHGMASRIGAGLTGPPRAGHAAPGSGSCFASARRPLGASSAPPAALPPAAVPARIRASYRTNSAPWPSCSRLTVPPGPRSLGPWCHRPAPRRAWPGRVVCGDLGDRRPGRQLPWRTGGRSSSNPAVPDTTWCRVRGHALASAPWLRVGADRGRGLSAP